jgi:hypothetical protein
VTDDLRFEVEAAPYDDDTTEMHCRDTQTGDVMPPVRPWGEFMKAIAEWCAGQELKEQTK